ncbi:hypothetical protein INR49_007655 [Caranx melampygus]|nr:hypothetical protein INR49_007655 [Caranx melampygus]
MGSFTGVNTLTASFRMRRRWLGPVIKVVYGNFSWSLVVQQRVRAITQHPRLSCALKADQRSSPVLLPN